MKQKLIIGIVFICVAAVLVGLNLASYTQRAKEADTELSANRSSFNSGATGTLAYFSLLSATGIKTVRWQEPPAKLLTQTRDLPSHFVVIGEVRREFTAQETADLLEWVGAGGQLIVIDREPPAGIIDTHSAWTLTATDAKYTNISDTDPANPEAMTAGVSAAKPVQPTLLTAGVNNVQPSIFASAISIRNASGARENIEFGSVEPTSYSAPPPAADVDDDIDDAPVAHIAAGGKNLVADAPYGAGRIIFVSDPYIVSNGGITLADNSQLAINLVKSHGGIVAFDEYHQGLGVNNNRFLEFFAETPVVAIFFQLLAVAGFLFYSQSRRFARPVEEPEANRLSKLEYISAMAALQHRVRAYDLAVENIYRDFKLRASRLLGLDVSKASASVLAAAIAERLSVPRAKIETDLDECEQIIYGQGVSKRRVIELIAAIREMEFELGLTRRVERK